MMQRFVKNNCRLCEKIFCCEKCRIKHEIDFHNVFAECDICIYGQFVLENLEESYLQHVETSHLPLNCVYCKRVFGRIEEILQHKKCPVLQHKVESPKTPFNQGTPAILIPSDEQDSPILQELQRKEALNYIFTLATSTPMQRGQEHNLLLEKSKDPSIPSLSSIISIHNNSHVNKSIIKKDSLKSDNSSNRRVTFGETPKAKDNTADENMRILDDKCSIATNDPDYSDKKDSDYQTPSATRMNTTKFYSAKSDDGADASSKTASDRVASYVPEGSTPVSVPIASKMITGKDIYGTQPLETNDKAVEPSKEPSENCELQTENCDLNNVSMELCTPAKPSNPLKEEISSTTTEEQSNNISGESNAPEPKSTNYGTNAKEDLYKNTRNPAEDNQPCVKKEMKEELEDESSDKENRDYNNYDSNKETEISDASQGKTLWLSAINLEEFNNSENLNENRNLNINEEHCAESKSESSQKPARRRVSILMPTPILKKTNFQMKFHIPSHMSSTPVISSGIGRTKKTTVTNQQTSFKTPQGKWSELTEHSFMGTRMVLETVPDVVAGPSRDQSELAPSSQINENFNETDPCKYIETDYTCNNESNESKDVSSMTESSMWTSMSRIVKSVLGGFTKVSQDSNRIVSVHSTSCKRKLSDDSSEDLLESPRFKRFKLTDIKCRRPIRQLPALEPSRRFLAPAGQMATFEIVKSVSTLYGKKQVRVQCDKATQTDDYLMYGWDPHV